MIKWEDYKLHNLSKVIKRLHVTWLFVLHHHAIISTYIKSHWYERNHSNKVQLLNIDLVCNGMTCRHILMSFNFAQHKNDTIDNAHYEIKHVLKVFPFTIWSLEVKSRDLCSFGMHVTYLLMYHDISNDFLKKTHFPAWVNQNETLKCEKLILRQFIEVCYCSTTTKRKNIHNPCGLHNW